MRSPSSSPDVVELLRDLHRVPGASLEGGLRILRHFLENA